MSVATYSSISTRAENVYLVVYLGLGRGVLAFLRVQLQRNVDEEEGGKYTESILQQSQRCTWLGRGVLELKLHEEESKFIEAIANSFLTFPKTI